MGDINSIATIGNSIESEASISVGITTEAAVTTVPTFCPQITCIDGGNSATLDGDYDPINGKLEGGTA